MRARQCEDVVSCDKQRCMGHHDWVSKEVNETDEVRWVERDTMDKTGTHHGPALTTHFARRAAIPGNLSVQNAFFLNGTDFGLHRSLVFRVLISPKTHAMKNLTSI